MERGGGNHRARFLPRFVFICFFFLPHSLLLVAPSSPACALKPRVSGEAHPPYSESGAGSGAAGGSLQRPWRVKKGERLLRAFAKRCRRVNAVYTQALNILGRGPSRDTRLVCALAFRMASFLGASPAFRHSPALSLFSALSFFVFLSFRRQGSVHERRWGGMARTPWKCSHLISFSLGYITARRTLPA